MLTAWGAYGEKKMYGKTVTGRDPLDVRGRREGQDRGRPVQREGCTYDNKDQADHRSVGVLSPAHRPPRASAAIASAVGPSGLLALGGYVDSDICRHLPIQPPGVDTCIVSDTNHGHMPASKLPTAFHGRRRMTYMGKPYYPSWLDNLADDVTWRPRQWTAPRAAPTMFVRSWPLPGNCMTAGVQLRRTVWRTGFLEDYPSSVRGMPTYVIVLVTFNGDGQTQRVVVNHRPRSAMLQFSRLMLEKFAETPHAKHWQDTP